MQEFKVGDKVRIRETSQFTPKHVTGEVYQICLSNIVRVNWSNEVFSIHHTNSLIHCEDGSKTQEQVVDIVGFNKVKEASPLEEFYFCDKPLVSITKEKMPDTWWLIKLAWETLESSELAIGRLEDGGHDVFFVIAESQELLKEYKDLYYSEVTNPTTFKIQMGRLFGYSDESILEFLQSEDSLCECFECVGYHQAVKNSDG